MPAPSSSSVACTDQSTPVVLCAFLSMSFFEGGKRREGKGAGCANRQEGRGRESVPATKNGAIGRAVSVLFMFSLDSPVHVSSRLV